MATITLYSSKRLDINNTLPITGATSGDIISVAIKKNGSQYLVAAANFGQ